MPERRRGGGAFPGLVALGAGLAVVACGGPPDGGRPPAGGGVVLSACQLSSPGLSRRVAAECGTLSVPEARGEANSRSLALRVAVVPAVSRAPAPDPLVFLTGGPGQAATESYVVLAPVFRRINQDRDVVLVDQRGTGGSNALRCPRPNDEQASELWMLDETVTRAWVERCRKKLAADADPRWYTSSVAIQDLEELRAALGYETLNLYGVSYGTRVALEYLRRHPERVRTILLDGVVPPTEVLGVDVARDAQRALDLLVARCLDDAVCREEFPKLERSLDDLVAQLEEPVPVALRHPRTGRETTLTLRSSMAAFTIRLLSYNAETAAIVPLVLREAKAGDLALLAAQYLLTSGELDETVSEAMGYSVICSEDFPRFDDTAIEASHRDTYLGALQTDSLKRVCAEWPRGTVSESFHEPVVSDVPALLLSGEADPVTPPSNGDVVAAGLSRSLHLVAPGQGHMVVHRGCIPSLAERFVAEASVEGLREEASCLDAIRPAPFFVGFAGPTP